MWIILFSSLCGWRNAGTERLTNTLKITQLLRVRAGIETQALCLLVLLLPAARGHCSAPSSPGRWGVPLPLAASLSGGQLQGTEKRFWNRIGVGLNPVCYLLSSSVILGKPLSFLELLFPYWMWQYLPRRVFGGGRDCAKYLPNNRWSLTGCGWSPGVLFAGKALQSRAAGQWRLSSPLLVWLSYRVAHPSRVSPHKSLLGISAFQIALFHWLSVSWISIIPCPSFSSCSSYFSMGMFLLTYCHLQLVILFLFFICLWRRSRHIPV